MTGTGIASETEIGKILTVTRNLPSPTALGIRSGGFPLSLNCNPSSGRDRLCLIMKRAHHYMCERVGIAVSGGGRATAAALVFLAVFTQSFPSLAQVSEDAMRQCGPLTNTVRRVTCYDLLLQLHVTQPGGTTGQSDSVTVRLDSEEVSKLDAWIDAQPEPKPSRREVVRWLLDSVLQSERTLDKDVVGP
jgi:hypothetical protein